MARGNIIIEGDVQYSRRIEVKERNERKEDSLIIKL
jgi:hypothetical protein